MAVDAWPKLGEKALLATPIFSVNEVRLEHPDNGASVPFTVVRSNDWVNVIPLTPEGGVVLIRQFRAGTEEVALEIPGGMIEAGEQPGSAAARELTEETGFVAGSLELLGMVRPNPAFLDNRCFTYLAKGCLPTASTDFDPDERIEVEVVPLEHVRGLIVSGAIDHSLVVAAFYHLFVTRAGGV
jgi:ADP-ribose pyrophosphatase